MKIGFQKCSPSLVKKVPFDFSTSGFSLDWESRFSVVEKYLNVVNEVTQRTKELTMSQIKDHWNRRLILPLELADALSPVEYAALIENLPTDYPVQVQAKSVRHYPQKTLAAHVLGYVGSGYEPRAINLSGSDLSTFEVRAEPVKLASKKSLMRFSEESMGEIFGESIRLVTDLKGWKRKLLKKVKLYN